MSLVDVDGVVGSVAALEVCNRRARRPWALDVRGCGVSAEWVMFTPVEEAKAMAPVVQANMMKYAQEHGIELPS